MNATESLVLATDGIRLGGELVTPAAPCGLVVLCVTAPSGAKGPRANYLARLVHAAGFATAVCELVGERPYEHEGLAARPEQLATRVVTWLDELGKRPALASLAIGVVGFEGAATAALIAAAKRPRAVRAVAAVSSRCELTQELPADVRAAILLVAGERDALAIRDNQRALRNLRCPRRTETIRGADHHFQQAGALVALGSTIRRWMRRYLIAPSGPAALIPFARAV